MDRVSASGYQVLGVGRSWQNKNLGAGIQGTTFDQVWFQGVQESIVETIQKAGITPADSTLGSPDTQLLNAIQILAGANSTAAITANTTLTPAMAGLVLVNAAAGNVTLTLPASASAGGTPLRFIIARTDSSGNTVNFALHSGDALLLGTGSQTIAGPGFVSLFGDGGSNWVQLAGGGSSGPAYGNQSFFTSGTMTVPSGVTTIWTTGCAGGAGGNQYFSGGAGQFVFKQPSSVTPGHVLTATIGAAGAGSAVSATAGGNTTLVDTTSATTLLTLTGATAPSGSVQSYGYPNGGGLSGGSTLPGASGPFGGGGGAAGTTGPNVGQAAAGYGAGGGQGQSASGGNGSPGYLLVEW